MNSLNGEKNTKYVELPLSFWRCWVSRHNINSHKSREYWTLQSNLTSQILYLFQFTPINYSSLALLLSNSKATNWISGLWTQQDTHQILVTKHLSVCTKNQLKDLFWFNVLYYWVFLSTSMLVYGATVLKQTAPTAFTILNRFY